MDDWIRTLKTFSNPCLRKSTMYLDWTSQRNKRHRVDADQDQVNLPRGVRL